MFISARDLLKIEYTIGYGCTVGVFSKFNRLGVRVSITDDIRDKTYAYEELLVYAPSMHNVVKEGILTSFAHRAKNDIEQFLLTQN